MLLRVYYGYNSVVRYGKRHARRNARGCPDDYDDASADVLLQAQR